MVHNRRNQIKKDHQVLVVIKGKNQSLIRKSLLHQTVISQRPLKRSLLIESYPLQVVKIIKRYQSRENCLLVQKKIKRLKQHLNKSKSQQLKSQIILILIQIQVLRNQLPRRR
jgi:hypothetical protein